MVSRESLDIEFRKVSYMVISSKDLSHKIILSNDEITSSREQELLRNLLASKLIFESLISSLCSKSGQKNKYPSQG